jgi:undecaprenyl-diphosphatase
MSDFLLSILLGVVEGLTEFLPVSSTAHLRICEVVLTKLGLANISLDDSFWKMYTIVIQLGAILALPVYFRNRIMQFLRTFPAGERGDRTIVTHPLSLTMIAFVITAGPAWALKKQIGENLENLWVIAWAILIGGIIMWIVDVVFTRPKIQHMEEMNVWQAAWIGAAQILSAVFPGTSRSMSTIAAGQIAGLSRPAALEFSFFLSMPTMVVATLYDLYKTIAPNRNIPVEGNLAPLAVSGHQWIVLMIGFVISFIVALAVVAWFMRWVRARGFAPFAIYRLVLGIIMLICLARGLI